MRIVEEDFVDWEPLRILFVAKPGTSDDRVAELARHLDSWFQKNAGRVRADCDIRCWKVTTLDSGTVEACCEHLKRGALRRLANSAQNAFAELDHVRVGMPIEGIPSGLEFRWVFLPAATVQLGRDAVEVRPAAISLHMVSIGQFTQFMREANYQPDADKRYGAGYCEYHWRLNWGKSPKIPAVGVTYYDARAFCDWAGLRLPSEAELHLFFVTLARQGQNLNWGGECWTSTPGAVTSYVLLDGPHHATLDCPFEEFRHEHSPDYYDFPFPAFRVAKTRAGE